MLSSKMCLYSVYDCPVGSFVVFEPVLAPGTHIGVRENGDIKKPSHTGTRKHARFTPIMKVELPILLCSSFAE